LSPIVCYQGLCAIIQAKSILAAVKRPGLRLAHERGQITPKSRETISPPPENSRTRDLPPLARQ
jgi:hypothetical protein